MKINTALKINRNGLLITDLYREVVQTLKNQWEFPSDNITIKENNGWITLYGEVPWNYQREAANAAVNQLPEVKGVINNLYAVSQERDDRDKKMLEIAISNSTTLQNKDIQVSVTDREVTLCGTVQSQKEKDEAEKISWTIPGVFIVNNELIILHG